MNSARDFAILGLSILAMAGAMAGCADKKAKVAPPAQAQAPTKASGDAGKAGALYPPPLISAQPPDEAAKTPPPAVAKTDNPPVPPPPPPNTKKPASSRKPKKPSTTPANTTADGTADATPAPGAAAQPSPTVAQTQAANELAAASGEPAAVSPIGELSTGGAAGQSETHKSTLDLINSTENGVNAIKRPLSSQEQATVVQIKTFLTKAKAAFENNDFDGAATLATKAKLLLDELNKD